MMENTKSQIRSNVKIVHRTVEEIHQDITPGLQWDMKTLYFQGLTKISIAEISLLWSKHRAEEINYTCSGIKIYKTKLTTPDWV
jgi:hypothetical protein